VDNYLDMDTERYHRQLILNGFGIEAQQKLSLAKVLVIGTGGLGCPALQYLAAAGIGQLGVVDHDIISLSNLHRQTLFATADVGKMKVEVAIQKLTALNPDIQLHSYPYRIQKSNIVALFKQYDYIVDGSDNFETRYLINDTCMLLNKPLIFAAVAGHEGQLAIFCVADEQQVKTNYRDLFPIPPSAGEILNCEENGVLGVLPGIIGTMQAAEVIKLITGIGKPLINKLLHYNLLNHQFYGVSLTPANVGSYPIPTAEQEFLNLHQSDNETETSVTEIDTSILTELQCLPDALIIDVREVGEIPLLNSQIYVQRPMSALNEWLHQDFPQTHVVLICQHGIRSLAAAEQLIDKYGNSKKIYSLKGGIARYKNYFSEKDHE
jgi:molybdopterin/thiamine biosynthesis adenylyltransferase/rhodanese-related sulfurtransferase